MLAISSSNHFTRQIRYHRSAMRISTQCNRCAAIGLLGFLTATAAAQPVLKNPGTATVEFLFVGLGDATLIRSPEGNVALIDAGPSDDVGQLLQDRGISSIDLVVITHRHVDHYVGMGEILRRHIAVKRVIENGSALQGQQYQRLLDRLAEAKVPVEEVPRKPTIIPLGSVQLRLLPPPNNDYFRNIDSTENDRSIGVRAEYGTVSFLIAGDANKTERKWWRGAIDPRLYSNATIYKLGHHGSASGTDGAWLDEVHPQVAVASMGLEVLQRHWRMSAQEVLQALQARRIKLYNTGLIGTISFRTNGQRWEVFKDKPVVDARVRQARTLARRMQLAAMGLYLCALVWSIKRWWRPWAKTLAQPITLLGTVVVLLLLYDVVGTMFGLADLFWHDQASIQLVAGIGVMLLFSLLVALGRNQQRPKLSRPTPTQEVTTEDEGATNPTGETGQQLSFFLMFLVLPAALPLFHRNPDFSWEDVRDRVWLPTGMATCLLVLHLSAKMVSRWYRHHPWRILTEAGAGLIMTGVAGISITLALVNAARPPAAISIVIMVGIAAVVWYATYVVPFRRYVTIAVVLFWITLVNGRDPYQARFEDLREYYDPNALVDISFFRGKADGSRGVGATDAILPGKGVALLDDERVLHQWKNSKGGPLVLVAVSGGGIAAAVWTAMCLERLTTSIPDFPYHVRVITGASGGMVAGAYFAAAIKTMNPAPTPV
jgi:competence protein ComEC